MVSLSTRALKKRRWRWGKIIFALLALWYLVWLVHFLAGPVPNEVPFSVAIEKIKKGEVRQVIIRDNQIELRLTNDEVVLSQKEPGLNLSQYLLDLGVSPKEVALVVDNLSWAKTLGNIFNVLGPIVLTFLLFWYLGRQAGQAQQMLFSFGKARARLFRQKGKRVTFADVAGLEEAKQELVEIIDFLKHPDRYQKMGARIPKGVLLVGPSGTGKTLLARATAGEAGVPFFSIAGSEFMEMLVGVGASRVRDLFATARRAGRAIIFIDEIDAIGAIRGLGVTAGHSEREQTLNQLLVEMDGLEPNQTLIVMAATNRPDILDPALTRPGRFDRRIVLNLPDKQEREAILRLHARGKPFAKEINWQQVAARTVGFSGADLENTLNEAAILAARNRKRVIGMEEINEAMLRVKLGPQKQRGLSEEDKKLAAYHEAGHAIVSYFLPQMDPVERISIVARGMALGFTLIPPQRDRPQETKTRLLSQITALLGGRAAEELVFGELTTGAAADIQQATKIARQMVIRFGMSRLGPIDLGPQVDTTEWGQTFIFPRQIAPQTQAQIDTEVRRLVNHCLRRAKKILTQHRSLLDKVAKALAEKETLERREFEQIMKKKGGEKK